MSFYNNKIAKGAMAFTALGSAGLLISDTINLLNISAHGEPLPHTPAAAFYTAVALFSSNALLLMARTPKVERPHQRDQQPSPTPPPRSQPSAG
jgi:hypothetical protein